MHPVVLVFRIGNHCSMQQKDMHERFTMMNIAHLQPKSSIYNVLLHEVVIFNSCATRAVQEQEEGKTLNSSWFWEREMKHLLQCFIYINIVYIQLVILKTPVLRCVAWYLKHRQHRQCFRCAHMLTLWSHVIKQYNWESRSFPNNKIYKLASGLWIHAGLLQHHQFWQHLLEQS